MIQSRFRPSMGGHDDLSDTLSIATEIYDDKVEEYRDFRPTLQLPSTRVAAEKFKREPWLHKSYVRTATRLASIQTDSADKPGGMECLYHIRDEIITSGAEYRENPIPSKRELKIANIIEHHEMLDESIMLRKWRNQKTYLKVVASELEAMALALYMDHKLLEKKKIEKKDKITKCSRIWKFSRFSERNLDIIRHLYVS